MMCAAGGAGKIGVAGPRRRGFLLLVGTALVTARPFRIPHHTISDEAKGLWDKEVKELLAKSCLRLTETIPFVFGLNRLYVAEKDGM
jgi:hypothetical protein